MSLLVLANRREQAGQLHELGDSDHSGGNVHTVLGPRIRHCSSHIRVAPNYRLDERVWCAGKKSSLNDGERSMLSNVRSMET